MGRKRKQSLPRRSHKISIRVTDALYEVIAKDAWGARMSLSEYVREIIAGHSPLVHYELVYNDEDILRIFSNLGACSNNLNQIARYLNAGGTMTNQIWKDVKNCVSELYGMRDMLSDYVGSYRRALPDICTQEENEVN